MINSEMIMEDIRKKLSFYSGNRLIFINDFEKQLTEIITNSSEAQKRYKRSLNYLEPNVSMDDILKELYIPTSNILEKTLINDYKYSHYRLVALLSANEPMIEGIFIKDYYDIFTYIDNLKKILDLEDLKKISKYFINILFDSHPINIENTLKLSEIKESKFELVVFLISTNRIVEICSSKYYNDCQEYNIQFELRKISSHCPLDKVKNNYKPLGYKKLLTPYLLFTFRNSERRLYIDTDEEAIALRQYISELWEKSIKGG